MPAAAEGAGAEGGQGGQAPGAITRVDRRVPRRRRRLVGRQAGGELVPAGEQPRRRWSAADAWSGSAGGGASVRVWVKE